MTAFGRPAIYPWEKWLAYRNTFTLKKGTHYNCTTLSMSMQFRARARRMGVIAHIHHNDDYLLIKLEHPDKE